MGVGAEWHARRTTHENVDALCRSEGDHARSWDLYLYRVYGTVQVLPSGASSWSATATRSTCTWQLAGLWAGARRSDHWEPFAFIANVSAEAPTRTGFELGSGCRLSEESWFLPRTLWVGSSSAWAGYSLSGPFGSGVVPGPLRYQGDALYALTTHRSSPGFYHSPCSWEQTTVQETWRVFFGLGTGSSYLALP